MDTIKFLLTSGQLMYGQFYFWEVSTSDIATKSVETDSSAQSDLLPQESKTKKGYKKIRNLLDQEMEVESIFTIRILYACRKPQNSSLRVVVWLGITFAFGYFIISP